MPQSMSKSQILRFIRICEDQNIRVTRTKKGLLLRFPDGTSTVQHFTNSDTRAEPNQISRFRRAGMVHPNDTRQQKEGLPDYITSGSISPKTRQKIIDYVASQGFPEAVLSSAVVKDLNMDPGWANRALYHSGFRPGKAKSKRVGRPWYTPEEILCLKEEPKAAEEVAQIVDDAPKPEPVVDEDQAFNDSLVPDPDEPTALAYTPGEDLLAVAVENTQDATDDYEQEGPLVEDIEYIDVRDSWTVDMDALLGEHLARMVKDRLNVLTAVGIDYEIRVWRTTK